MEEGLGGEMITKKLKHAALILSDEQHGDCDPRTIVKMIQDKDLSYKEVYTAMRQLGYVWKYNHWGKSIPKWLKNIRLIETLSKHY